MNRLLPFVAAGTVVLALTVGLALLDTPGGPDDTPRLGSTLTAADRDVLDVSPVVRGADAPPADPAVDMGDPEAVARAYLVAAHTVTGDDAGRTHLRAASYAQPGSPPAVVGVVVLDPPAPGEVRRAAVTALELVAADPGDRRRAYLAAVETATGAPAGPLDTALLTGHVVLAHQPDGRWLVASDTAENPDLS
ncbi:MAG: hypothetical protein ACT4RN_15600 [Pseudonocardia sp.]